MEKQLKVEEEMCGRGYDSRQRKVQLNITKGKESENDYARSMIEAVSYTHLTLPTKA